MKSFFEKSLKRFKKNWLGNVISVVGLSVAVASSILILLWVQNEINFDNNVEDRNNVFFIKNIIKISNTETWTWDHTSYALGLNAKQIAGVKNVTCLKPVNYGALTFRIKDKIFSEKKVAFIDDKWFDVFKYKFLEGSSINFNSALNSVILTKATAQKYFGDQSAIGKSLKYNDINYQVQGVIENNISNSSFQYNVLLSIKSEFTGIDGKKMMTDWGNANYMVILELLDGVNSSNISQRINQIYRLNKKDDSSTTLVLESLADLHFSNDFTSSFVEHGNQKTINTFFIIAFMILSIASINYINLSTANASSLAKEVAIRKIIGGDRLSIFLQFVYESILLSAFSFIIAFILIEFLIPWFRSFTDKNFEQPLLSPTLWIIFIVTFLFVCLMNSIYPAFMLSSFKPTNVLKGKLILNIDDTYLRYTLIIVQIIVSAALIFSSLVIYFQLKYINTKDIGYNRHEVFSFEIPYEYLGDDMSKRQTLTTSIKNDLLENVEVNDVSIASANFVDFKNRNSGSFDWYGRSKDYQPSIAPFVMDESFHELVNLRLKDGRWLSNTVADMHNVMLNERAAVQLGLKKPIIGQSFIHQGDTGVVVGVVKDFHFNTLHNKIEPMVITHSPGLANAVYLKASPGQLLNALEKAKKVWEHYIPDQPFVYNFMDEDYNRLYNEENAFSVLVTIFASLIILISAFGLFAIASFTVKKRIKEIAIRKVLGANISNIIIVLSKDFAVMVIIANLIALPMGWYFMREWLNNFNYRINFSFWMFGLSATTTIFILMLPIYLQTRKASSVNPTSLLNDY